MVRAIPTTFVLVHYPTAYSEPVGIWWWNPSMNSPTSYYIPGAQKYHDLVLGLLGTATSQANWDGLAQKFADRTPSSDAFSADSINVSPKAYLRALRKPAQKDEK